MNDVSISLPAKRKRGRPRKDGNIFRQGGLQSPENLNLVTTQRVAVASYATPGGGIEKAQEVNTTPNDGPADGMVGRMIYGVIDGSFDAGYFISVRIGNDITPFRGVVFQPRKFVPVSASNDIAPEAKLYHRQDIPVPVYNDLSQISGTNSIPENTSNLQPVQPSKQEVYCPILPSISLSPTPYTVGNHSTSFMAPETVMLKSTSGSNMGGNVDIPESSIIGVNKQSQSIHPTGCLRMVEQNEVMQAFEVSTSSKGCKNTSTTMGGMSESSFKVINDSFSGKENISQKSEAYEKTSEPCQGQSFLSHNGQGNSNVELHLNTIEGRPPSSIGMLQDEMISCEMEHPREFVNDQQQTPSIELQEIPPVSQVHPSSREPEVTKTNLQPNEPYYNGLRSTDINLHQYLCTNQSQQNSQEPLEAKFHPGDFVEGIPKSPNLKLDLSSSIHDKNPLQTEQQSSDQTNAETNYLVFNELKNPNVGYHQALVSGNPLFLPPDLMPDFLLEKTKPPCSRTPQETNLDAESFHRAEETGDSMNNVDAGLPSSRYKLELAAPQSNLNICPGVQTNSAGCSSYMDFVHNNDQPMESHDPPK